MTPRADLERELGAPPPRAFEALDARATADLAAMLADTRRRRRAARRAAADRLAHLVPGPLRERVRRELTR